MRRVKIFKRQKIPDRRGVEREIAEIDVSVIVPIVWIEPIVVPERFKVERPESEERQTRQKKESIVDRFVVNTSELDEINKVINGH